MKSITQERPMGCGIACAASLAGFSYKQMRRHFENGEMKDYTSGFYNRDIINALAKIKIKAKAHSIKKWGRKTIKIGTIVFTERSKNYPAGHYLLKTKNGWMNPWINFPNINSAKTGFQKTLSDKIMWVIEIVSSEV
mgnify:CR=1 FL=1